MFPADLAVVANMLVTLGASVVAAQTTDFSGTWTFDAARSQGAPTLPSIAGSGVKG